MTVGRACTRRRLFSDASGVAAVEFAMLALPLVFMIFMIIELSLHFMVQMALDNATSLSARQLRTGTVVADGASDTSGLTNFTSTFCGNMSWLSSQCSAANSLVLDVRPLSAYASSPGSPTINGNGTSTGACWYSGSAGTAVEMRSYFRWQMPFPALIGWASPQPIQSTEVFQVEPNNQTNSGTTPC